VYDGFVLQHFELTPVEQVGVNQMPCILLLEGEDKIVNRSKRDFLGYPLTRSFELHTEVWIPYQDNMRRNLLSFYQSVRQCVLKQSGKLDQNGSFVRERNVLGPYSEPNKGSLGMRILLEIIYKDNNL